MSARAPQAITDLWLAIKAAIPKALLGGIVGDAAHVYGYHCARNELPSSDYSVILPPDHKGAGDCASALDVTLPPDLMILCTGRLVHAARVSDPRLRALREFCGTLNGKDTFPWQLAPTNGGEGVGTWDKSHLWHIHISILREFADDEKALLPIADVFAGVPLTFPPNHPNWSDTVDQSEVQKMIDDSVLAAQRAVLLGGDHGEFTHAKYPLLVKDEGSGVLDRLVRLESGK